MLNTVEIELQFLFDNCLVKVWSKQIDVDHIYLNWPISKEA